MNVTALAPLNCRVRNIPSGSIGWALACSTRRKIGAVSAATSRLASTTGLVHPWLGASMRP